MASSLSRGCQLPVQQSWPGHAQDSVAFGAAALQSGQVVDGQEQSCRTEGNSVICTTPDREPAMRGKLDWSPGLTALFRWQANHKRPLPGQCSPLQLQFAKCASKECAVRHLVEWGRHE